MDNKLLQQINEYTTAHGRKKRWHRVITTMAAVVVFCTTYALILPAITKEGTTYCGYEEHLEHSEADGCYTIQKSLVCTLPENGHQHTKDCYEEVLGHVHVEECYDDGGNLECELPEDEAGQIDDSDNDSKRVLICQEPEVVPHEHTDECYSSEKTLTCEKAIHQHTLQCYSNPNADVESESTWKDSVSQVALTGRWGEDVIAIAESQLGYTESQKNYMVSDDGTPKGYTRYGAWYGDAYGDWCAMFASFCLNYAGVDSEKMPLEASCQRWVDALSQKEYDLYHPANAYKPHVGDLVFFDLDNDFETTNRRADHVGIITEVVKNDEGIITNINTIEGNKEDRVQYGNYEIGQRSILGYGELPKADQILAQDAHEDGDDIVETDGSSTFGLPMDHESGNNVSATGQINWNGNSVTKLSFTASSSDIDNAVFCVQYKDSAEDSWNDGEYSAKTKKGNSVTLDTTTLLQEGPLSRQYRIRARKDDKNVGYTEPVTLIDLLDAERPSFGGWLRDGYVQDFGGEKYPETKDELYAAFKMYFDMNKATIKANLEFVNNLEKITLTVTPERPVTKPSYQWQYYDTATSSWKSLTEESASTIDISSCEQLKGGKDIRCKIYSDGKIETFSEILHFDNGELSVFYEETAKEINNKLGLGELGIGGKKFNDYFYYGNVAKDSRVPFDDAKSYTYYLCKTYKLTELESGTDAAVKAVREIWDRYLYDIYDPNFDSAKGDSKVTQSGDQKLLWSKDGTSSFHASVTPKINALDYNFLEHGVDYSNFITGLNKTAKAVAPGDANTERKFDIEITADVQAKMRAPVAMIFQIPTSWHMFDMKHANAQKGELGTQVGSVAYNTELATLYDIKHALLRFADYMETQFPGNNLVIGVTETKHGGSTSMFTGETGGKSSRGKGDDQDKNKGMYVTNDVETLRKGLYGWDSFGNCEHNHYDSNTLESAVGALKNNLSGWKDFKGSEILYEDIQKVVVVLAGASENTNGSNGYGCVLPWETFGKSGINSVYGIRTNVGTPVGGAPIISWIDHSDNNSGKPFEDASGSAFTKKYVATSEDAIFHTFVEIANKEMLKKGLPITAEDKYVEDVEVTDTIADEFKLDRSSPITLKVLNKKGTLEQEITIPFDDPALDIKENADGTTTITYTIGKTFNTKKYVLGFRVVAKEDYIGSNNVFSNVGTPDLDYMHKTIDAGGHETGEEEHYSVMSTDTPEVNVPIRFDTVDGDRVTVQVDEDVNLGDLSHQIVQNAEDLVDNYDKINGTLEYVWVMPDGSQVPAGSVDVKNGSIGDQHFPSRDQTFTPTEGGNYEAKLQVTFKPNKVEDKGHFSDENTKEPVNALTKPGSVWIEAIDAKQNISFYVRKVWEPEVPADIQSVTFRVLADGEPVRDSHGDVIVYTLSAENNWETLVQDLPPVKRLPDGNVKVIQYTVEETPVPSGYAVSYSNDMKTEVSYSARITVGFTAKEKLGKKTYRIYYTYNGKQYQQSITDSFAQNESYSFTVDNLPVDQSGEPFDVRFDGLYKINGNKKEAVSTSAYIGSATSEKYVSGSITVPVKVITNKPGANELTIEKRVIGASSKKAFSFTATLESGQFPTPPVGAGYTIDSAGVAHFKLKAGASVTLNVPKDAKVILKETNPEGFIPLFKKGSVVIGNGNEATVVVSESTHIIVENTTGYELPQTGGPGDTIFILSGLTIVMFTVIYSFVYAHKRGRRCSE